MSDSRMELEYQDTEKCLREAIDVAPTEIFAGAFREVEELGFDLKLLDAIKYLRRAKQSFFKAKGNSAGKKCVDSASRDI